VKPWISSDIQLAGQKTTRSKELDTRLNGQAV
jgi:hypothetical protein